MKKVILLLVIVILGVFSGAWAVLNLPEKRATQQRVNPKDTPYAYITSRELVVVRGSHVLARVRRFFNEEDNQFNQVVWTYNGKYVTFLSDDDIRTGDSAAIKLMYVNAYTGAVGSASCSDCDDITAIEDSSILATSDSNDTVFKINPENPHSTVRLNAQSVKNQFLTVSHNYIVTYTIAYPSPARKPVAVLTFVQADNLSKYFYASVKSYGAFFAAPVGGLNTPDQKIAIAYSPKKYSRCGGRGPSISLLDPQTRRVANTDISATESQDYIPHTKGGMAVNGLWSDLDGHLHATIITWGCPKAKLSPERRKSIVSPFTSWRLDGNKWIKENTRPATMVRELNANTRISLLKPSCFGGVQPPGSDSVTCNRGKLYLDSGNKRTLLADRVLSISTPPAQTAPLSGSPAPSFYSPSGSPS